MVKKKSKKKVGRHTKYKPIFAKEAEKLCQEKGYTDKNLAVHFKVSEATINNWKHEFLEFLESLKKGKDDFDSRVVEQSLLKRAVGYSYVETTRELDGGYEGDVEGDADIAVQTLVVTKKVNKHMAPDVTAQIFWLKNRRPQRWSDVKEVEHRIEEVGKPLTIAEMKKRLLEAEKIGLSGLDQRSIEGGKTD